MGWGPRTFDIAGDYVSGKLADLTLTLAPTSSISIAGVTLTPSVTDPISLEYLSTYNEYTLTGGAVLDVPGLGSAIDLTASGTYSNNILQNLALTVAEHRSRSPVSACLPRLNPAGLHLFLVNGDSLLFRSRNGHRSGPGKRPRRHRPWHHRPAAQPAASRRLDLAVASDASITVAGVSVTSSSAVPLTLDYLYPRTTSSRFPAMRP